MTIATNMQDQEFFAYLDELRESGVTNMFHAPAYLQREFGLTQRESFDVFGRWTEAFGKPDA